MGLTDGGGTFIISFKSRAEYIIEARSHRERSQIKSKKETILSFALMRKLFIFGQLDLKGSTYIWGVSNKKALVQIVSLFKKHSLRTKRKVEFLK